MDKDRPIHRLYRLLLDYCLKRKFINYYGKKAGICSMISSMRIEGIITPSECFALKENLAINKPSPTHHKKYFDNAKYKRQGEYWWWLDSEGYAIRIEFIKSLIMKTIVRF